MPTALTQLRQFGWQATQLNFIGKPRFSTTTPAYAEQLSMATRPSNAMQRLAALSNIQAPVAGQRASMISFTSAGYRVGLVALGRICTGSSRRCHSCDAAPEPNLGQR